MGNIACRHRPTRGDHGRDELVKLVAERLAELAPPGLAEQGGRITEATVLLGQDGLHPRPLSVVAVRWRLVGRRSPTVTIRSSGSSLSTL